MKETIPPCSVRATRRLRVGFSFLAALFLLAAAIGAEEERPNVVIVMTDDQGYGDFASTGNALIDTPHLDALAEAGASFERFYVSPVCAPTRASLMTGRYHHRTRVVDTWRGRAMMEPAEVTLAEVLRDAGYRTGIFGKWHLGDCYPMRPQDQGFDEVLVHRGGGLGQPSEPPENERRYTDAILFHNGEQVATKGYCTDVYFDAALAFIDDSLAREKPFFAYVATNAPHDPLHDVPEALYEKYRARDLTPILLGNDEAADKTARIFAMIENIDDNVGRLSQHLEARGVARDTLFLFLSDNGPAGRRYVGEMRGTKSQVYEGGIRSPLFLRWPERIEAGRRVTRIAAHYDLMPTILDAVGIDVPKSATCDGRSLFPLLTETAVSWPERNLFLQAHRGDVPVVGHNFAVVGPRWKLLRPSGFGRETLDPDQALELYDLFADPREEHDLSAQHPQIVERLFAAHAAWFEGVSTTRPDNYEPPRIIVGTRHEPVTVLTRQDWRRATKPGWGRDGVWNLLVPEECTLEVTVRFWDRPPVERVQLRLGEEIRELAPRGRRELTVSLGPVQLPPGELDLGIVGLGGGERLSPYQVTLSVPSESR